MQGRNRHGTNGRRAAFAAKLPAGKKASKNNGQNWTLCCKVSSVHAEIFMV
jgi:hypothetical protein